ncbi:solute symporter family protein [Paraburkholderia caballeronis]|uniref:solute symporter family protein n=1 Tax=Paraburkholderia caballeronis TaxID=416943 RepID=UPI00106556FE|nr:cation/acetate symporter ActP [Paraburkholderia caballeronis]TDV19710.1 cation/acetate symporter [Paraburkholderia caballeronis]TDV22309.1 cation/acetate symporter [Paraburkholderia caballeronis]TDV29213.1 cation/acetate symporter [Paraburkholderia caballeronis]
MIGAHTNVAALFCFFAFLLVTIGITVFASRKAQSASEFFNAGGQIGAGQNAFAMAGEFLSAAALLGMTGALALTGFDAILYSICVVASWPLILFGLAQPIKRLGTFTLTDVIAWRLSKRPVRIAVVIASIPIVLFYLITQLIAAGGLVNLIFGLPYFPAVVCVGAIMLCYVLFGGMRATTWVQIIKAVLLLAGATLLTALVLSRFHFSVIEMFRAVTSTYGVGTLAPRPSQGLARWDMISLALAMTVGALGMPQILTRFLTVGSPVEARRSALYCTGIVGVFHLMVLLLGFGCLALVGRQAIAAAGGAGNMAVPLLSQMLGGNAFFGYICAVSFSTTLAVVAGLTLSAATTFAHDIWAGVVRRGHASNEARVAKIAATVVSIAAVLLAQVFEHQNVAFMVGLSYSIAASANFPVLALALFWRRLTTAGAVCGILAGAAVSVVLILLSPTVQIDVLHRSPEAFARLWWCFPMKNPALFSIPLSFVSAIVVSLLRPEPVANAGFDEMQRALGNLPPARATAGEGLDLSPTQAN